MKYAYAISRQIDIIKFGFEENISLCRKGKGAFSHERCKHLNLLMISTAHEFNYVRLHFAIGVGDLGSAYGILYIDLMRLYV